jgi:hypothetical protein
MTLALPSITLKFEKGFLTVYIGLGKSRSV